MTFVTVLLVLKFVIMFCVISKIRLDFLNKLGIFRINWEFFEVFMGIFGIKSRNKRIEYSAFFGNVIPSPTRES